MTKKRKKEIEKLLIEIQEKSLEELVKLDFSNDEQLDKVWNSGFGVGYDIGRQVFLEEMTKNIEEDMKNVSDHTREGMEKLVKMREDNFQWLTELYGEVV